MKGLQTALYMAFIIFFTGCPGNNSLEKEAASGAAVKQDEPDVKRDPFVRKRKQMVRLQIEMRGIDDEKVLSAMRKVPRHEFVPDKYRAQAYYDHALPIGYNQTISQPYVVAFMTQALELKGTEKVLEIGTGSGYQAAILAEIVPEVYSIEIICELLENARKTLDKLGYKNITTMCGDGYKGWVEHAPFDAIIVTAAPDEVPPPLLKQLKPGGRLILPEGSGSQELKLYTKTEKGITSKRLLSVRFVPMTGEAEKPGP